MPTCTVHSSQQCPLRRKSSASWPPHGVATLPGFCNRAVCHRADCELRVAFCDGQGGNAGAERHLPLPTTGWCFMKHRATEPELWGCCPGILRFVGAPDEEAGLLAPWLPAAVTFIENVAFVALCVQYVGPDGGAGRPDPVAWCRGACTHGWLCHSLR